MTDNLQLHEQQRKRAQAVRTAWILGLIAFAIFAVFIGAAMTGN